MTATTQSVYKTTATPQSGASAQKIEHLEKDYAIDLSLKEIDGKNAYRLRLTVSQNIPGVLILDDNQRFEDEVAIKIKELKDKIIKELDVKAVTAKLLKNTK